MTQQPYGQYPPQPGQYPQPQHQPPAQYPSAPPQAEYGAPEQFGRPSAPQGGGEGVGLHQLANRLVLFRPLSFDPMSPPMPGVEGARPGPLVMAEAIVLDGPPIPGSINGTTEVMTPFASGPKMPPFYVASMYIRGAVLPGQLADSVPSRSFVLGRIIKGQPSGKGKPPWILQDATQQDEQIARQHIGNRIQDGFDRIKAASAPEPAAQPFAGAGGYQQVQPQPQGQFQPTYGQPPQAPPPPPAPYNPGGYQQGPPQQPQPYGQPNPAQYPPAGPPAAPWAQPQQADPYAQPGQPQQPPW